MVRHRRLGEKSAAEAGDQSPVVFVFLPKHEADQIKDRLASYAAAEETLRAADAANRRGQRGSAGDEEPG